PHVARRGSGLDPDRCAGHRGPGVAGAVTTDPGRRGDRAQRGSAADGRPGADLRSGSTGAVLARLAGARGMWLSDAGGDVTAGDEPDMTNGGPWLFAGSAAASSSCQLLLPRMRVTVVPHSGHLPLAMRRPLVSCTSPFSGRLVLHLTQ